MQVRMVSAGIYEELALLCSFFLIGVFLAASYDVLRILRGIIPHGTFLINLEDLIYWIMASVFFFLQLCRDNNGIIRFFILLGLVAGAGIYERLISRHLMKWLTKFIHSIKKQLKKAFKKATMKLQIRKTPRKTEEKE